MSLDPYIAGGLLSGLGSMFSSMYDTGMSFEQSKELMDYQYKLQQQAIDKVNAFNHPAAQMKRLAAAHLNPNLVYGSGVDGNQSSPANPSVVNRTQHTANPLQDLGQNLIGRQAFELEKIRARNEAFESKERQLNLRARTLGQMLDNSFNDKTLKTRVQRESQKLVNDISKNEVLVEQANNMAVQRSAIKAQADYIASRTNLTEQQALTEVVRRESLRAGIALSRAQIAQVAHYIEYLDAGTALRGQQYTIQDLDFESSNELNKWLQDHPNIELGKEILDYLFDKINGKSRRSVSAKPTRRRKKN